jgi:hypothetical protein
LIEEDPNKPLLYNNLKKEVNRRWTAEIDSEIINLEDEDDSSLFNFCETQEKIKIKIEKEDDNTEPEEKKRKL